jgi:hypothetical protein
VTKVVIISLCVFVFAMSAFAVPVNPFNVRQVAICPVAGVGGCPPGNPETSLQSVLNTIYGAGVINAATDQQSAGVWTMQPSGPPLPPGGVGTLPIIQLEEAGTAGINQLGLFSGTDSTSLNEYKVFNGVAGPGAKAALSWDADGTFHVAAVSGACGVEINCTAPAGIAVGGPNYISPFDFGFFLDGGNQPAGQGKWYTADSLNSNPPNPNNGGGAQALAYTNNPNAGRWTIAFENRGFNTTGDTGTDRDFNDFVFVAESISPLPIPEPRLLGLLASAMLGLCWVGYRRRKNA